MDQTLFKADIFFVITTLAVVLVTVILLIGLGYVIGILASIQGIVKQAERATEHVAEDIDALRDDLRHGGFSWGALIDFFRALIGKRRPNKRRAK